MRRNNVALYQVEEHIEAMGLESEQTFAWIEPHPSAARVPEISRHLRDTLQGRWEFAHLPCGMIAVILTPHDMRESNCDHGAVGELFDRLDALCEQ